MTKDSFDSVFIDNFCVNQGDKFITSRAYINYLVGNGARHKVIATVDISDISHNILLSKNAELTATAADDIDAGLLSQPLEMSIHLSQPLDSSGLMRDLQSCIEQDPFFFSLYDRHDSNELFGGLCSVFAELPLLQQKITIMADQLPELYRRSLSCCLLMQLLAMEMRLPKEQKQNLLLAALSHDVAMLDVDPSVLNKRTVLLADEWEQIQSHVERGCRLLSLIEGINQEVVLAVAEHHERCDGTGYPLGQVESELSIDGQLLALVDSVTAIYFNHFNNPSHSWRDTLPIIKLNEQGYFNRSLELLNGLIRRSVLPLRSIVNQQWIPAFAEALLEQNLRMNSCFSQLKKALTSIGFRHGDRRLHALQNLMLHIATSFKGSMLSDEGFRKKLEALSTSSSNDLSSSIEDASLLQQEMDYHLRRLSHMLNSYLAVDNPLYLEVNLKLKACLETVHEYTGQDSPN